MAQRGRLLRFALAARLPRLRRYPPVDSRWPSDWPVVQPEHLVTYPMLASDLDVWLKELEPRFRRLDHRAQILQNQFWRLHLGLILGGLLATVLGAVQAARGGGVEIVAVVQAILTGALAGLTVLVRSRRAQQGYLDARLKAERIKSEFFLFMARTGAYAGEARLTRLHEQVDDIEMSEGGP